MAKDRRDRDDRELALGLQELEVTPPAQTSRRDADADLFGNEEVALEGRMMFAVEMLQTLSTREQLAVISAMLPNLLEELDAAGRAAVIDELMANASTRQPT